MEGPLSSGSSSGGSSGAFPLIELPVVAKDGQQAVRYIGEGRALVGVPPQAAAGQARVLGVCSLREGGEVLVGLHIRTIQQVGQLPSVEGPHQDSEGVDVGASGDLGLEGGGGSSSSSGSTGCSRW